jgi:hypothetical protein
MDWDGSEPWKGDRTCSGQFDLSPLPGLELNQISYPGFALLTRGYCLLALPGPERLFVSFKDLEGARRNRINDARRNGINGAWMNGIDGAWMNADAGRFAV